MAGQRFDRIVVRPLFIIASIKFGSSRWDAGCATPILISVIEKNLA
jgi:hypothetical protein